jgi:hypothetical protein
MRWLRFKLRWWRWFLGGPNIATLVLAGVDHESRKLIYDRHDAAEPRLADPPAEEGGEG